VESDTLREICGVVDSAVKGMHLRRDKRSRDQRAMEREQRSERRGHRELRAERFVG
jgi:hypothetical protein